MRVRLHGRASSRVNLHKPWTCRAIRERPLQQWGIHWYTLMYIRLIVIVWTRVTCCVTNQPVPTHVTCTVKLGVTFYAEVEWSLMKKLDHVVSPSHNYNINFAINWNLNNFFRFKSRVFLFSNKPMFCTLYRSHGYGEPYLKL